jgi:hypothetical protein
MAASTSKLAAAAHTRSTPALPPGRLEVCRPATSCLLVLLVPCLRSSFPLLPLLLLLLQLVAAAG